MISVFRFQSTAQRTAGRNCAVTGLVTLDSGFQSTAQRTAGRNQTPRMTDKHPLEFQSTAQRTAGRNFRDKHANASLGGFNPPPSAQPGGTRGRHVATLLGSFNPPPSAQPGGTGQGNPQRGHHAGFNPPPSAQPGGTTTESGGQLRIGVSIHRPAHSRAEHGAGHSGQTSWVSIHRPAHSRAEPQAGGTCAG